MTWVKLDDGFMGHPKVRALSHGAICLHLAALCWSSRYLTDGFIPACEVGGLILRYKPAFLKEVLAVQPHQTSAVWDEAEGGYRIHDYLVYQPSARQATAERAATAERQRKWKERAVTNGVSDGVSNTAPSRPVPSLGGNSSSRGSKTGEGEPTPGTADAERLGPDGWGNPEATGPNESPDGKMRRRNLALRLKDATSYPDLLECNRVVAETLGRVDWRIVDEQIGWLMEADDPPRKPAALLAAVHRTASR